jgi:hypothetical protein
MSARIPRMEVKKDPGPVPLPFLTAEARESTEGLVGSTLRVVFWGSALHSCVRRDESCHDLSAEA